MSDRDCPNCALGAYVVHTFTTARCGFCGVIWPDDSAMRDARANDRRGRPGPGAL